MNLRKINSVKQGYDFIFLEELAFLFIIKWIFFALVIWSLGERRKKKMVMPWWKKKGSLRKGTPNVWENYNKDPFNRQPSSTCQWAKALQAHGTCKQRTEKTENGKRFSFLQVAFLYMIN